ncbi:MAG: NAD-dependent epimerase/dehydratase family protein, partial [Myxococcota bacterium]|nr:NAD-dependent epimerase/dehydratase family protein [Myxococcota bacterium]
MPQDHGRLALVTGGAGFIGSHLVSELLDQGWRVRVLDDFSSGSHSNLRAVADQIEVVCGDVRDEEAVTGSAAGVDVIFHQAAIASVPRSIEAPLETNDVNLGGTLQVLEAARIRRAKRVVFASSSAVYGDVGVPPLRESDAAEPISPYGFQKLAAEFYLRAYAKFHGVETVALRYFNVYGERQNPRSEYAAVIPIFLSAAQAGEPLCVHGDGDQTRDFIHAKDVARANLLAADAPGASGGRFNVASGRGTRVSELVSLFAEAVGRELSVVSEAARPGDIRYCHADVEAAR